MNTKIKANLFVSILGSILAAGCATRSHDFSSHLAPDARATLKGSGPVRLMAVDGNVGSPSYGFGKDLIYLSPGTHTVMVECWFEPWQLLLADSLAAAPLDMMTANHPGGPVKTPCHYLASEPTSISVDVLAGHNYALTGKRTKNKFRVSVEDRCAGKTTILDSPSAEGTLALKTVMQ